MLHLFLSLKNYFLKPKPYLIREKILDKTDKCVQQYAKFHFTQWKLTSKDIIYSIDIQTIYAAELITRAVPAKTTAYKPKAS